MTASHDKLQDAVTNRRFSAVIFDLDGTLIDSETTACHVLNELVKKYAKEQQETATSAVEEASNTNSAERQNSTLTSGPTQTFWSKADHYRILGQKGDRWAPQLLQKVGISEEKVSWTRVVKDWEIMMGSVFAVQEKLPVGDELDEVTTKAAASETKDETSSAKTSFQPQIPGILPGAAELVDVLKKKSIPLAIATSSSANSVGKKKKFYHDAIFSKIDLVVTGDEVTKGKPDPEHYLKTAEKLGFPARECLVFEDSALGCLAAKRAGCFVVAVPDPATPSDFVAANFEADLVLGSKGLLEFEVEEFFYRV
ncbi:unnamed protein product [Amoebophrya sp. A120]|nr:unnamed protein product [Amoebophrya sp. A120]|eukprot:GSA120T00018678001.1